MGERQSETKEERERRGGDREGGLKEKENEKEKARESERWERDNQRQSGDERGLCGRVKGTHSDPATVLERASLKNNHQNTGGRKQQNTHQPSERTRQDSEQNHTQPGTHDGRI